MHIGHQTDIIIIDFAKAFDKVNHNKLIYELKTDVVDMLTVEWIEAFHSSRSQVVVLFSMGPPQTASQSHTESTTMMVRI